MSNTTMRSLAAVFVAASMLFGCPAEDPADETPLPIEKALVGKLAFFDTGLSSPPGQSCASCHSPDTGYAEPHAQLPVSQGADPTMVGNRNSPSAAYVAFSPSFHFDEAEGVYVGGVFWDGRADDLVAQAQGPFLANLEMAMADEAAVIAAVKGSDYAELFEIVFGEGALDDVPTAYVQLAEAIAAYESTDEVNRFTSKYDYFLAGEATLTAQEGRGLDLFEAEDKGNCAACHPSEPIGAAPPLFTDFTYDNLGVPKNPDNPFYDLPVSLNPDGQDFVDLGLGGFLEDSAEDGKFKVPTLRNIGLTAPYMHNGVFSSLDDVVDFYNTRDVGTWDPPEVPANVNDEELGDLGLTADEVEDIVAFLMTLSDGWAP